LQYIRHLKCEHESRPRITVSCHFDGCKSSFTKVNSYAKHVRRHHPSYYRCSIIMSTAEPEVSSNVLTMDQVSPSAIETDDINEAAGAQIPKCQTVSELVSNIRLHLANFTLCFREQHSLPSVVQEQIVSKIESLVSATLTDYSNVISSHLPIDLDLAQSKLGEILDIQPKVAGIGKQYQSKCLFVCLFVCCLTAHHHYLGH